MIIGIGLDLVDIARVRRLIAARGDRALNRLFTDGEVGYAMSRGEPSRHLAARVAAKEAAFKALAGSENARGIGWREMEVVSEPDGRPKLLLHGSAAERAEALGVSRVWIALTHSSDTAAAVVVMER